MDRRLSLAAALQSALRHLTGLAPESTPIAINDDAPFVFFWRETDPVERGCFSQWYMRDFNIDGQRYCCMEQYMMAQKARLFGDGDVLARILASNDPAAIKRLGREVRGFDPHLWDRHKCDIVYHGNLAKFSQNSDLLQCLLATSSALLVEASPYDRIWGIGLAASDPRAADPALWRGQNLLGFLLTAVRAALATP